LDTITDELKININYLINSYYLDHEVECIVYGLFKIIKKLQGIKNVVNINIFFYKSHLIEAKNIYILMI